MITTKLRYLLGTLAASAGFLAAAPAHAEFHLARIFGDHMVLQRDLPVPIWGWAEANEKITAKLDDKSAAEATAGPDGKFTVKLPASPAGGPHTITVQSAGGKSAALKDVLFGEVWLCSGQSNMEKQFIQPGQGNIVNYEKEVAAANHPTLRMFDTAHIQAPKPAEDLQGEWRLCTPTTMEHWSTTAYFFGRELNQHLNVPVGLILSSWGGTPIEPWTPPAAGQEGGTGLYNGMIAPLVSFPIRGATWYQGEANVGQGMAYHEKMKALIGGWRGEFKNPDMPFYFVQLASFHYNGGDKLPELWEAQLATLAVPHTGMAVITDASNVNDIHPANKQDVGKRLALWALAKDYGVEHLVYSGPLYKSMAVEGDKVRLTFHHVGGGLVSRDEKPLSDFTIAGEDGKFVPAEAAIDGETVVVHAAGVAKPTAVRFAWNELAQPNFANKAGLPASPFRTDSPIKK
jgi:sialate O-acetylesterase